MREVAVDGAILDMTKMVVFRRWLILGQIRAMPFKSWAAMAHFFNPNREEKEAVVLLVVQ